MFGKLGESSFTKTIKTIQQKIYSRSMLEDSLYEQAENYFHSASQQKNTLKQLHEAMDNASLEAEGPALKKATQAYKRELKQQQAARYQRFQEVQQTVHQILHLSEGQDWEQTQVNSAKMLGTLFLLSPGEGAKLSSVHQKLKPLYKAILAARLMDKHLRDGQKLHPYINDRYQPNARYASSEKDLSEFQQMVVVPVIFAALFQDIGLLHPECQAVLKGEDVTQNEFRVLSAEERNKLLKLNFTHTLDYIVNGLGIEKYVGNSKDEKARFVHLQRQRLSFVIKLLKDATRLQHGIGNLIKVPQIYSSVVFSTKQDYRVSDLPKASLMLLNIADKGIINRASAEAMVSITGHFPQGFGVVYIPVDDQGQDADRYEYAIVNRLNPTNPRHPLCRLVTRNMTFNSFGNDACISGDNNLHYPAARKKLARLSPTRLREIMTALYANYQEEVHLELLPQHWHPYMFFCYQAYQNLWNQAKFIEI